MTEVERKPVNPDYHISEDDQGKNELNRDLYHETFMVTRDQTVEDIKRVLESQQLIVRCPLPNISVSEIRPSDIELVMVVYGVVLVARPESGSSHVTELEKLISIVPDSLLKLRAWLLLIEYYYKVTRLEEAWKHLYRLTSASYSLGLHKSKESRDLWRSLVFFDTIICSTAGRPTSIYNSFSKQQSTTEICVDLIRKTNTLMMDVDENKTVYSSVIQLDALMEGFKSSMLGSSLSNQHLKFLLLCSVIKLHYPFFISNRFSRLRLKETLSEFMIHFKQFLQHQSVRKINFKWEFTFAFCFSLQSFIVLLTCFYKGTLEMENDIIEIFADCYTFSTTNSAITIDHALLEIFNSINCLIKEREAAALRSTNEETELYYKYITDDPFSLQTLQNFLC
jgi:hypothetical protein